MIKAFEFELKTLGQEGTFTGLASTYHNEDQGGDVVVPGAFTQTLAQSKDRPLLFQHSEVVGVVSLTDSPEGLKAAGQLNMAVQRAAEVHSLMKQGAVRGLSIGYRSLKDEVLNGVRFLQQVKLFEVSLTPFAMNEMAVVHAVKSVQQELEIKTALDQFRREILEALKG